MGEDLFNIPLPKELQHDTSGEVCFRPLNIHDLDKNFISLLSQLTNAPNISKSSFVEVFQKMQTRYHADYVQLSISRVVCLCFFASTTLDILIA
jgi:hypothetical protein